MEYTLSLIFFTVLFMCSAFAFVYGGVHYFKPKVALYAQLITCAMGCFAASYLFSLIHLYVTGSYENGFQVGNLGLIGGMAFLFSASYGQMDGLVDDHSKEKKKYRLISLLAPTIILILYMPSLFGAVSIQTKIVTFIQFVFIGPAAYYNLKHLIIPDVELGIIKSVRSYNLLALVLELLVTLGLVVINLNINILMGVFAFILAIIFVVIIPILKGGIKKWTMS